MKVLHAVERDLGRLDERKPGLSESSLAAQARALALALDNPRAAMAVSANSRELREIMAALEALAPPEAANDDVDDLKERARLKLVPGGQ